MTGLLVGLIFGALPVAAFYEHELARLGRYAGRRDADNKPLSAKLTGREG